MNNTIVTEKMLMAGVMAISLAGRADDFILVEEIYRAMVLAQNK